MKRSNVGLDAVAAWDNLTAAFLRAARGKARRPDVLGFRARLLRELAALRGGILDLSVGVGATSQFMVFDPKRRVIHAPVFRERVLHHALIRQIGPSLDAVQIDESFACRKGKGALAAVRCVQAHLRRSPWYLQLDMRRYFDSIAHERLRLLLRRRLKNRGTLALLDRIVACYQSDASTPRCARGVPIGALTSQYFANLYLAGFDRWLLALPGVVGVVRYMDDVLAFCADRATARQLPAACGEYLDRELALCLRLARVQPTRHGVRFCGYRVLPRALRLSTRRRRRYAAARRAAEQSYLAGRIDARQLQVAYQAALAATMHADALAYRRAELVRHPGLVDA
ncbi:MAG: RNA-directed DNA polymerase [Planctomycetota bacterium]